MVQHHREVLDEPSPRHRALRQVIPEEPFARRVRTLLIVTTSLARGLTDAEVAQRVADGKTNDVPAQSSRSVSEIVRANVLTRINAILGVLLLIVLATG